MKWPIFKRKVMPLRNAFFSHFADSTIFLFLYYIITFQINIITDYYWPNNQFNLSTYSVGHDCFHSYRLVDKLRELEIQ